MRWASFVVTIACSCGEKPASAPARGSDEPVKPAKVAAPERPALNDATLPTLPPPPQSAEATFTAQVRDDEWAPTTETEIKRRLTKIRGAKLEATECRQNQCRLVLAGSEGDVGQTIADLEGTRGLHGFATNVLLTAPERRSDGTLVLRAFAMFER
jgi:hypothetical protein